MIPNIHSIICKSITCKEQGTHEFDCFSRYPDLYPDLYPHFTIHLP